MDRSPASWVDRYPKVSIITPSYNEGQFLGKAIQSVLDQNYPNLEYIIIDGGSTDNSLDVIKKYESQISYWISEPDRGQTDAINKGLSVATGEILTELDTDDTLLPGSIQAAVECFKNHPEAGFVYGDCLMIDQSGNQLFWRRVVNYDWGILFYGRSLLNQPASFFRREVIDQIGLMDEQMDFGMDLEYWIRAAHLGIKFQMLPFPMACSRIHPSSKTSHHHARMLSDHLMILQKYRPWPWKHLGSFAGSFQYLFNTFHHGRLVLHRMWQRHDFGIGQARRAQRMASSDV